MSSSYVMAILTRHFQFYRQTDHWAICQSGTHHFPQQKSLLYCYSCLVICSLLLFVNLHCNPKHIWSIGWLTRQFVPVRLYHRTRKDRGSQRCVAILIARLYQSNKAACADLLFDHIPLCRRQCNLQSDNQALP